MTSVARRCRPLLGTLVEIRVEGLREAEARDALDAAFAEIAAVHRLMSFHEPDSDVSRLHRARIGQTVAVDPRTSDVLACARRLAALTHGIFDITIGAQLVHRGVLPRPVSPFEPERTARWDDVELLDMSNVRLRRALWLDLGGIAKGYAVDRAVELLQQHGATQVCVNAGGDLRVSGARAEPIHLRAGAQLAPQADLELADGAVATSTCADRVHLDGRTRAGLGQARTVSVLAPRCLVADALTKVALAPNDGALVQRVLAACDAQAFVHAPAAGWLALEHAA